MDFDPTQFKTIISKINSALQKLADEKLPELDNALKSFIGKWYIPGPIKDIVKNLVKEVISGTEWLIEQVKKVIVGTDIPIMMSVLAKEWTNIEFKSTGVSGEISPENMTPYGWSGVASTAYTGAITQQTAAAAEIGKIADATDSWLTTCATAGIIFYGAVAAILVPWIFTIVAAAFAVDTVVGAPAGAAAAGASTGLSMVAVGTLLTAWFAFSSDQVTAMEALYSQASNSTGLDGGHWPTATATTGVR